MNILIVDDEIPAVQGIMQVIDWQKLGIDNVYTAYSMQEAIKQFSTYPIDILLTDIEMSGGTGFDLIRWCNLKSTSYISIILSGFPNFRYAQNAISLSVSEYLLKPVEDSQLESALVRAMKQLHANQPRYSAPAEPTNPIIEQVKNYVYNHMSQEISRKELASLVGLAPEYFSTYFRKETGLTLSDYIKTQRISFAKRLLKQTTLPMSIISESAGYDSLSYFSCVFKQMTGLTPREYRHRETGV